MGGLGGARQTGESLAEGSPAWESPLRPEASARRRCLKFGAKGVCSQGRNPGPAPSPHAGRGPWTSAWEPPGQSAQLQGAGLQCADPYVPPTRQALRRSSPQPAAPKRAVLPASPALGGSQGPVSPQTAAVTGCHRVPGPQGDQQLVLLGKIHVRVIGSTRPRSPWLGLTGARPAHLHGALQ